MKKKNGFWYSLKEFTGYKFRAKFVAEDKEGKQVINTDIYTDNEDRSDVSIILCLSAEKKGLVINRHWTGLINWSSKEQDDEAARFINDTLKDI